MKTVDGQLETLGKEEAHSAINRIRFWVKFWRERERELIVSCCTGALAMNDKACQEAEMYTWRSSSLL